MSPEIAEKYGHRTRLRACGLCWQGDDLLMINHAMGSSGVFWAPPGGGIEFGQGVHDALIREFLEETHLTIRPGRFLFVCEFIDHPLHALELFFEAIHVTGSISLGIDPESTPDQQLIQAIQYLPFDEIKALPEANRHGIFRFVNTAEELKNLSGFYGI